MSKHRDDEDNNKNKLSVSHLTSVPDDEDEWNEMPDDEENDEEEVFTDEDEEEEGEKKEEKTSPKTTVTVDMDEFAELEKLQKKLEERKEVLIQGYKNKLDKIAEDKKRLTEKLDKEEAEIRTAMRKLRGDSAPVSKGDDEDKPRKRGGLKGPRFKNKQTILEAITRGMYGLITDKNAKENCGTVAQISQRVTLDQGYRTKSDDVNRTVRAALYKLENPDYEEFGGFVKHNEEDNTFYLTEKALKWIEKNGATAPDSDDE